MFAALTPDRKTLTLAVVNATDAEQQLDLNVAGLQVQRATAAVADDRQKSARHESRGPDRRRSTSPGDAGEGMRRTADGRADSIASIGACGGRGQ